MKYTYLIVAVCYALSLCSCVEKQVSDFDYSKPIDLSEIIKAYNWYHTYLGDDKDSILSTMIAPDLPEWDIFLYEDNSFALHAPEYAKSGQPFLASAEDFYNGCALAWNVWSNFEVWYRGELCNAETVRQSIKSIGTDIIKDKSVRIAAQQYVDSMYLILGTDPYDWDADTNPQNLLMSFQEAIENKAYSFYREEDEASFCYSLDSIWGIAEGMAKDRLQRYINADEEKQVKVMLDELAACKNFDEQCSLWRNWANCDKSPIDDEWIIAVGRVLMTSGNYSPILHRVWLTWRALCQSTYFGLSRDSAIPNNYYNEFRKLCYIACLKHIEQYPNDAYAMNCATVLGGERNMNRFGRNNFGNEALIECAMLMPERYNIGKKED